MDAPYQVCCIGNCNEVVTDDHHEPLRNQLSNEHRDLP